MIDPARTSYHAKEFRFKVTLTLAELFVRVSTRLVLDLKDLIDFTHDLRTALRSSSYLYSLNIETYRRPVHHTTPLDYLLLQIDWIDPKTQALQVKSEYLFPIQNFNRDASFLSSRFALHILIFGPRSYSV